MRASGVDAGAMARFPWVVAFVLPPRGQEEGLTVEVHARMSMHQPRRQPPGSSTVHPSPSMQARDEDGNRRLEGGDDFSAALYSPHAVVTGSVRDLGDGSYAVAYVATVAGVYELHVTAGQEHVAASPYPLRVDSGPPCPRRSAATGEGRGRAVTGRPARFSVLLHDAHGNRCGAGAPATGVPLETELTGPGPAPPAVRVAWDEAAGRYDCEYCLTSPGLYRLHLASGGVPLPGAPFSVRCVVAGEDAEVEESRAGPGAQAQDCAGQGLESAARPVQDLTTRWEEIARAAYLLDGDAAGWDSDGEAAVQRTPEDEYIKVWVWLGGWVGVRIGVQTLGVDGREAIPSAAHYGDGGRLKPCTGCVEDKRTQALLATTRATCTQRPSHPPAPPCTQAHPDVPVVENLEDIWQVSKLQAERKEKEEREKQARLKVRCVAVCCGVCQAARGGVIACGGDLVAVRGACGLAPWAGVWVFMC